MLNYINKLNKRPKLSSKAGITLNELRVFKSKIVGIFGLEAHSRSVNFTFGRMEKLFKHGHNFAFLYLKECVRLTIRFLSGSPETVGTKGIIVARDYRGLPMIFDSDTRQLFVEGKSHKLLVTAYLTLLSVFRVFPTKVAVKLDTIVSDFTGVSRSFDLNILKSALRDLLGSRMYINLPAPKLIKLESASPNGTKSAWGASIDSLAFIGNIKSLGDFSIFSYYFGSIGFVLGAYFILILSFPLVSIFGIMGLIEEKNMGKLGVVYDQAGKARVVGITNYGVQLALKPLHDTIFRLLKTIEEDGTFDQTKKIMYLRTLGKRFHCFDLSAATDRLPIDIQKDLLNLMKPHLGTLGGNLLDFSGKYKGDGIKYSVGQPMGAYSSGAMLALTHHVIVRIAALRVGIKKFTDYSVLGDDIVICNDDVASNYLSLMETLGVSINLSKSVISDDIMEFAKRGVGPDYDITPIGPGLILRFIRSPYYIGALLNECVRLSIIDNFPKLLMMTKKVPSELSLAIGSTVGLGSYGVKMYGDTTNVISYALSSCNNPDIFRYSLYEALTQLRLDEGRDSKLKLKKEMDYFYRNWGLIFSSKSGPERIIEFVLKLVGPGFGCYGLSYERALESLETFPKSGDGSWDCIRDLATSVEDINTSSIDGTQKQRVKSGKEKIKKLNFLFERARDESESYFSS